MEKLKIILTPYENFIAYLQFRFQTKDGKFLPFGEIPYNPTWEAGYQAKQIYLGKIVKELDNKLWQKTGAKSLEQYVKYSWSSCGIACLKMILKKLNPKDKFPSVIEFMKKAIQAGVFKEYPSENYKPKDIWKALDGAFHKEYVKFIQNFGLSGNTKSLVSPYILTNLLKQKKFIIASVHSSIQFNPPNKGNPKKGHLILITGFLKKDNKLKGFYINDNHPYTNEVIPVNHFVSLDNFKKCFSRRIIIIKKSKK